jgi:N-acetyl-gamma-glutamyl-phosphate reductase
MLKIGIVGGTGYTGVELIRLLVPHPRAQIQLITSRTEAGIKVADMFPNLRGHVDLAFTLPTLDTLAECEVLFFATPNGTAMQMVPELLNAGVKVIDLAADFRLKDPVLWQDWYGMPHQCPELLAEAVYGLPELNRTAIAKARLIANPGCYPTAISLGFIPLLKAGLIDAQQLIADAKSGVSGAGRQAKLPLLLGEVSENFKAYGVSGHRHLPEICQTLNTLTTNPVALTFVPHLLPTIRGIHATLYAPLRQRDVDSVDLQTLFTDHYQQEPFVEVLPADIHPETRSVRGTNKCQLAVCQPQQGDKVVVLSVIDNLVKGAAGQAIQNMNLLFGLPETMGLEGIALLP